MTMKRLHLFEFEDQKWFKGFLRDYVTEILRHANDLVNSHLPLLPLIKEALDHSEEKKIVDLCSGAIGPWDKLYDELNESCGGISLTLTDKYPNKKMCDKYKNDKTEGNIIYLSESIDARDTLKHLKGMRTLFSSAHHFKDEEFRKILMNACDENNAICVFEYTQKKWWTWVGALLSPLFVVCSTPYLRPVTFARIFWTYIVPVVPAIFLWEAFVSYLRSFSLKEFEKFAEELQREGYVWKTGNCPHEYPGLPVELLYMIGYPEKINKDKETK
jgi:hypothetical protein